MSPPAASAHQVTVTTNAMIPVTKETTPQAVSTHDCGSRIGVSSRRRVPASSSATTYSGVGAARSWRVRNRIRSRCANPRVAISVPIRIGSPTHTATSETPTDRPVTTTVKVRMPIGSAVSEYAVSRNSLSSRFLFLRTGTSTPG